MRPRLPAEGEILSLLVNELNRDQLLAALVEDTGADVVIYDLAGHLIFQSPHMNWWTSGQTDAASLGKHVAEQVPTEFAQQHLGLIQQVVATAQTFVISMFWRGVRTTVTARPLRDSGGHIVMVLFICRGPVPGDAHPSTAARPGRVQFDAAVNDRGALAALSPRETEILGLIAEGLTSAEIAQRLRRSRKTVEAHRLSMGAKLGVSNRVELARIALLAGLRPPVPPQP